MKVPHYDQVSQIITPYAHPEAPIVLQGGGWTFTVYGRGHMGTYITTILPDGWKLGINIRLEQGMNFRLVGAVNRKSSFGISLTAPDAAPHGESVDLARDLTDTDALRSDPRLAKLAPVVDAAFAALPAALAISQRSRSRADAAKADADAKAAAKASVEASAGLDRFRK